MQVVELIQTAAGHLAGKGFENARLEVERMLGNVLGMRRIDLYMAFDRPLTDEELEAFRALYRRRLAREPLQYILGSADFRDIEVATDRRALIPRPETELLAGEAAGFLTGIDAPLVADIGTGTGVIAISILFEVQTARAVAVDISDDALMLARANAARVGVEDRLELVAGDMLTGLEGRGPFDAILSNPPYVRSGDMDGLDEEVRAHEPHQALDGGGDGLTYLNVLADGAHRYLRGGGMLLMECGENQAQELAGRCRATGRYDDVRVIRDLAGRDRLVRAVAATE